MTVWIFLLGSSSDSDSLSLGIVGADMISKKDSHHTVQDHFFQKVYSIILEFNLISIRFYNIQRVVFTLSWNPNKLNRRRKKVPVESQHFFFKHMKKTEEAF